MFSSPLLRTSETNGAALIGIGLVIVLTAQVVPAVPIAAAIALVGWGAQLTLFSSRHNSLLGLVNLPVYATLVSFAVASQIHAELDADLGKVPLHLVIDHALAVLLLVGLTLHTTRHLTSETE